MDVLSDVLESVRLRSRVLAQTALSPARGAGRAGAAVRITAVTVGRGATDRPDSALR